MWHNGLAMETNVYWSLDGLASELALPRGYLRELVFRGEIPFLCVRGRLRFDVQAVREALKRVAEQTARKHRVKFKTETSL